MSSPWITHLPGRTPLVLDSPHSGTRYPDDFGFACDAFMLRHAEDTHVEKLYAFAPALGVGWVEAHFPRSYLDANRNTTEVDPDMIEGPWPLPLDDAPAARAKVRLGKGLIWRMTDEGEPLYDRRLPAAEVMGRIERCWQPYHAAVAAEIAAAHARHGYSLHVNCHSMPAVAAKYATDFPGAVHPDFVIGNRDDSTSAPALVALMARHLTQRGYSVSVNHPYKGVELVRRHGRPVEGRHSIQLEINRRLYMDEASLALNDGFGTLQETLRSLVDLLLGTDPRQLA